MIYIERGEGQKTFLSAYVIQIEFFINFQGMEKLRH